MPRQPRDPDAFRFNAKKVGLTYSCPLNVDENPIVSSEDLQMHLETSFGPGVYIIALEKHESGKNHFHVYYNFDKKIDSTDARLFDYCDVHPNIIAKPGVGWMNYCKKDKMYITNVTASPWMEAMACNTAEEAIEHLWLSVPKDMLNNAERIEANMKKRKRTTYQAVEYSGPYPKEYYDKTDNWDPKTHSLLLWGLPNTCKTSFAKYLMNHKFGGYQFVKAQPEQLKKLDFSEPFLYDEVYMIDKPASDSREITDVENGGTVTARYGHIDIPPGVPRIFTSNYEHPFNNPQGAVYDRRVVSAKIEQR